MAEVTYEIRITGDVPESFFAELKEMEALVEPSETILYGPVVDQAALHGILDRIYALGLQLVEVRRLPRPRPSTEPSADKRD